MTPFQSRAAGVDAAVWAVLVQQIGTLKEAKDVEAVISGAMAAVTRLTHQMQREPDAERTVETLRLMAEGFVSEQEPTK